MATDVPQVPNHVTWNHRRSIGLSSECGACGALVPNTREARDLHERFHEGVWHTLRALSLMRENVIDLLALEQHEPAPAKPSRGPSKHRR